MLRFCRAISAPALGALLATAACRGSMGRPVERGDTPPPFSLETLQGEVLRFPEGFAGRRGVVVRFWSATCPVCEGKLKDLDPVAGRLAGTGVSFVAINVGQDRGMVEAISRKLGVGFPLLVDGSAATAKAWGVQTLPTTFFLGSDGRVVDKLVGDADAAAFEESARRLVAPGGRP